MLSLSPTRYVGRISYSLYLWHWPLLVFAGLLWGALSPWAGFLVVLASVLPAIACYELVERRFRSSRLWSARPRQSYLLGGGCTAVAAFAGIGVLALTPTTHTAALEHVTGHPKLHQGHGIQHTAHAVRPNPADAGDDRGKMYADGCLVPKPKDRSPKCVYGDTSSSTTVVLFGDSHAMQWFPALDRVAKQRGWRLVGLTKSGCPASDVTVYLPHLHGPYDVCDTWRARALDRIKEISPAIVVIGGFATYQTDDDGQPQSADASHQRLVRGYVDTLEELKGTGARVVLMRDTPHPGDVRQCVANHLQHLTSCAATNDKAFGYVPILPKVARQFSGATLLDSSSELCRDDTCPAVIGNALVYRNGDHLTATFARTMAPWLNDHLPRLASAPST
ncbi:MAG TPA: acyltransferase family protein [Nocardioidaceae bacterium]|nr:acyltransferase family protein [Nocardioidaceae bacterium]